MKHITEEILYKYLLGELAPEISSEVSEHLEHCSSCRDAYTQEQAMDSELRQLEQELPSYSFSRNVMDQIETDRLLNDKPIFWIRFTKLALIAAILIVTLLALFASTTFESKVISVPIDLKQIAYTLLVTGIVLWLFFAMDRLLVLSK